MVKYFFKNKLLLVLSLILLIFLYFSITAFPFMFTFVTQAVQSMSYSQANFVILYSSSVIILIFIFMSICNYLGRKMINFMLKSIRSDMVKSLINRSFSDFYVENESSYISSLLNDMNILDKKYFQPMQDLVGSFIQFICYSIIIILTGGIYIYLIVIACVVPLFIIPNFFQNKLKSIMGSLSVENSNYTAASKKYIFNFDYINLYGKSSKVIKLFDNDLRKAEGIKYRFNLWYGSLMMTIAALSSCVSLILGVVLNYYAIIGFILFANLMMMFELSIQMNVPLMTFWQMLSSVRSTKPIREKIIKILESKEEDENKIRIKGFNDSIAIDDLNFKYEDADIIKGITCNFKKNKKYLIVGESGCGKSTLLKLILGYYENYSGSIKIDGNEVKSINQKSLLNIISYVHQNVFLFHNSVKDNITAFDDTIDSEKIDETLSITKLKEVMDKRAEGIDTVIDESSNDFSGGEKQRISISRALVKDHDILFMDEGTSALDNVTSDIVDRYILTNENITVIAIAHKLKEEILKLYDEILVLEKGKLVESGTFDDLMVDKKFFYDLFIGWENSYEENE